MWNNSSCNECFQVDDYPFLYYLSVFFKFVIVNSHINHVLWKQLTCANGIDFILDTHRSKYLKTYVRDMTKENKESGKRPLNNNVIRNHGGKHVSHVNVKKKNQESEKRSVKSGFSDMATL